MSVTIKYEFLVKDMNSTKDLDSNICRDVSDNKEVALCGLFEIVVMTVVHILARRYMCLSERSCLLIVVLIFVTVTQL